MKELLKAIEELRIKLERHKNIGLKEYPTRTIFIDPLVTALGWDVRDPNEVELEYPTIDGKSVDYAMKINRKPVFLLEAKPLNDSLDDVKSITQVVGYAANNGIEWCVLSNGVRYKIYKSSEKASAPEKLLYEVSIDPKDSKGKAIDQIASQLIRLSRESMAEGVLDKLGSEIFTAGKVRKALDKLFLDTPQPLIRLVRKTIGDDSVTPAQITQALTRIWDAGKTEELVSGKTEKTRRQHKEKGHGPSEYSERHHIDGKPNEVVELYRGLDRLCQNLSPGKVIRTFKAMYVSWSIDKSIFCCAHLQQGGLRVWVKGSVKDIDQSDSFVRDVSKVGHWGVGDIELALDDMDKLRKAHKYIQNSFEKANK